VARYDLKGTGRFGGRPVDASLELLTLATEVGWTTLGATTADLSGRWTDDEEFERLLAAAGWAVHRPRRRRFLEFVAVSHGDQRATARAGDMSVLRRLLSVSNQANFGTRDLSVRLRSVGHDPVAVQLTLFDEADVLEVVATGPECNDAIAAVKDAAERAAPEAKLQLSERPT